MSDFRRVITALAVLALLTGFGVTASAQGVPSVSCAATVVNLPTLRAEGITELVGDIQVLCTNNAAAPTNGVAAFTVFVGPSATVTSRTGEAGLIMNPNDPTQRVFTGTPVNNTVTFSAVPVNPAGSATSAYLITNVRINATGIGAGTFGSTQVLAFVTVSGFNTPVSLSNAGQNLVVGVVQSGLTFSVRKADNSDTSSGLSLKQCNKATLGDTANNLTLRYAEGFQAAFKTAAQESGSVVGGLKGTATTGTRLRAVFKGIPTGTSVYVAITNSSSSATNLAQLTLGEIGPFFAVPATDQITVGANTIPAFKLVVDSTGTAEAVWDVQATDPSAVQNLDFPIFFAASANAAAAGQQGTVNGSFAPFSTVTAASDTAPVPRFADNSTPKNVIIFNLCKTSLLFPFVSAANGFDTGIAIANTTADGGTTTPQSGTCSLNFFGASAPSAVTTQSLNGGDVFANVLSSLAPGYQGYIIATCNFQDAHGFAFVQSTVGYTPSTAAMGYLALTLPRLNAGESFGF